jgi:hypothetical protein
MRTSAANIFSQLCGCDILFSHYLLYVLSDMHKKNVELAYLSLGFHALPSISYSTPKQAFRNVFLMELSCEMLWKFVSKKSL